MRMRRAIWIGGGLLAVVLAVTALLLWQSDRSAKPDDLSRLAVGAMETLETGPETPPTPDYAFTDAEGRAVTLADFRGRVVVLNAWAMWCPPCREEMPTLQALQAAYSPDQVLVLPVNVDHADDGIAAAKVFIAEHDLPFYGDRRFQLPFELPGGNAMPRTVIIGADGRIRAWMKGGADWNSAEARAIIDAVAAGGA